MKPLLGLQFFLYEKLQMWHLGYRPVREPLHDKWSDDIPRGLLGLAVAMASEILCLARRQQCLSAQAQAFDRAVTAANRITGKSKVSPGGS